ncbi:MAG: dihydrofolate reductase family protein [Candidatus Paceibacterota bacterium]
MKTFIIAALTADGFIAKNDQHPAFWTSKEDKKRFVDLTKRAGVVVMGSKTFSTLPRPLSERLNIVYSRTKTYPGAETMNTGPVELLRELEKRGFKEVAICGGSEIYTMFMKANVVDTLYLTIEPLVFGNGIKLFKEEMLQHLKLVSLEKAENGALLLEYKVDHAGTPKTEIEISN